MPKNIEDMIVPERKRSIRDIPIPEGRKTHVPVTSSLSKQHRAKEAGRDNFDISEAEKKSSTPSYPTRRRGKKGTWITVGAVALILVFALLSIFNGATLAYVPKSQAVSFNNDAYTARKSGEGALLYSIVKLSGESGIEVVATGEEAVERKASGVIIIFNTSNINQRLRATTRFETPEGKVYQVEDAIVIPRKTVVGGVDKPGTLEVRVYAEHPGAEYNIGLTDFTLPGLKGTSLFSSIYARSKTETTGGFSGMEKIVASEDKARAQAELQTTLVEKLTSEANAQVPEGFILIPSLSSIAFEERPQTNSESGERAVFNMRANLSGVMFKRSNLSNRLAAGKVTIAPGETVDIAELGSLNFSLTLATPAELPTPEEIKFSVTGNAMVVWQTDEVALKADLLGKEKAAVPSILNNYPTVVSVTASVRPFWKKTFPSDGSRISIEKISLK
ncbi:MAG: hypothetical protein WD896_02930 [Parcubacteria group bacterium]